MSKKAISFFAHVSFFFFLLIAFDDMEGGRGDEGKEAEEEEDE